MDDPQASVVRYKPRPIEELVKATRFSRKEIQHMYRGFKQVTFFIVKICSYKTVMLFHYVYINSKKECPSGIVNEQMFKEIYAQFFPQGGRNIFEIFSCHDLVSSLF